jgi:hypothetical protein
MEFLDETRTRKEIRLGIQTSQRADLAVAFWGDGAIEELDLTKHAGKLRIICNLETGGTNPKVVEQLIEIQDQRGSSLKVRQNDRLHAKVYLFDDFAIVGSSNASTNGLAFEGSELTHWLEANILTRDPTVLASLRLWMNGLGRRKVTSGDLARAKAAWKKRRSILRLPRDESSTILEALRFEPGSLTNLPIFVAIYDEDLSLEGASQQKRLQEEWGTLQVELFEDWAKLPANGLLLCFYRGTSYEPDGVWERRGKVNDREENSTTKSLQVVWQAKDVFGKIPVLKTERDQWRKICENVVDAQQRRGNPGIHLCIPLLDVLKKGYLTDALLPGSLETDVWRSIRALEAALGREKDKTVRLSRTRPKIDKIGERDTVRDLVLAKRASEGFGMLIDRRMGNRTFEAVALRHPERFDEAVSAAAKARLQAANIAPSEYLIP